MKRFLSTEALDLREFLHNRVTQVQFFQSSWINYYSLPWSKDAVQRQVTVTGKCLCETNTCQTVQICL